MTSELRPLLRLALPVVVAELGWSGMWLVDTMVVGRVGPEAIAAISVGSHVFFGVAMFGIGLLLGLDYVVAFARGAGDMAKAQRALAHGILLALVLTVALSSVLFAMLPRLGAWGIDASVLPSTVAYTRAIAWSLLPLLLFTALRRYLQALAIVRPIMWVLLAANVVNLAANWVLVFGNLGFPALGAEGSGWATFLARVFMFAALLATALAVVPGALRGPWRIEWSEIGELMRLGLPAAVTVTLEVGVFAFASFLAGQLDPISTAAHQIALACAACTFMVPLGISSAAAVRVGHALGGGDRIGAWRSGWTAFALGAGFMSCTALLFFLFPRQVLRAFTPDQAVLDRGVTLLFVAAVFQLFDGIQTVATGALRGTGETRLPMLANLAGHWLLGLPLGYWLCFRRGWGVLGLWVGLCTGLVFVAATLLAVWWRRSQRLREPEHEHQ